MPERVTPADPGLLASLADEISLPGYALRNAIRGDFGAAGRNLADFGLNIIDAPLPGDLIPEISGEQDRPEFRDLFGTPDGFAGEAVNFAGNVLTDPLTFVPGAAVAKGLGAAGKAIKAVTPEVVQKGAAKVGETVRRTFGDEKIGKPLKDVITKAQGAREVAGRASGEAIVEGLKGSTQRELEAARDVLTNVTRDKATKAARVIDETETLSVQDRLMKYVMENPDVDPDRLAKIVNASTGIGEAQWASGKASGPGGNIFTDMAGQPDVDVVMGALPGTTGSKGIQSYFPHIFKDDAVEDLADRFSAAPSAVNERKLTTAKALAEYLNANPEITLADAGEAMAKRGAAQGELAARGAAGKGLMEMARAQGMELPDELLAKAFALIPRQRAVVTEGGGDIGRLLGGDITRSGPSDIYSVGSFSGAARPPTTPEIAERALDPYGVGIGSFSGRAKPPVVAVEEVAPMDIYGIGSFSGKSKPPATAPIEDAGESARALYGVGGFSGRARPPATPEIAERASDPYGVGQFSGQSRPPATPDLEVVAPDPYGVGRFSGKSVVGPSAATDAPVAAALREIGLGGQTGKSAVGKSTATETGLTAEQKKQARDWLLSQEYKQADPLLKETALAIAKNLPGDEADVALHMLRGMDSPRGLTKTLGNLNRHFKKYAVFGAIVPKLGAITRNMTSALFQKYSTPEARGFISPKNAPQFLRDWFASIEDGLEHLIGKRVFTKNEFSEVDAAFRASGGDPRLALGAIRDPIMRQAVERGVLGNNFVDTEQLIAQASKSGIRDVGNRLMNYPASMFRGAEQRMRYGLFRDMVKSGKSPDDAARVVREAFFDYTTSSPENRAARGLLPFFQYTAKAIPQQASLMAEKPWIASVIANLMAPGRDEPVTGQMEGKLNLPIGQDEQGNRQYLSNLGLPFEALNFLPNLSADLNQAGRQVQQNIVGSSQPLLKTALAATFGEDPYFGTPFQSYTKVGGQDLGPIGGTLNTLLGTGLPGAVPIQGILGTGSKIADDRTSLGEKAVNLLTGARITSVDPDRALQQRLQAYLESRPDIPQYRSFFQTGDDAATQDLLEQLKDAQKRIKEKKKAEAAVN